MDSSSMHTGRFNGHLYRGGGRHGVGVCPGGVPGGVVDTSWTQRQTPPRTEGLTDRCKNITLPQTSFAGCK